MRKQMQIKFLPCAPASLRSPISPSNPHFAYSYVRTCQNLLPAYSTARRRASLPVQALDRLSCGPTLSKLRTQAVGAWWRNSRTWKFQHQIVHLWRGIPRYFEPSGRIEERLLKIRADIGEVFSQQQYGPLSLPMITTIMKFSQLFLLSPQT